MFFRSVLRIFVIRQFKVKWLSALKKADDSESTNTIYHDAMCGSNVNKSIVLTSRGGVFQSVASRSAIIVLLILF